MLKVVLEDRSLKSGVVTMSSSPLRETLPEGSETEPDPC